MRNKHLNISRNARPVLSFIDHVELVNSFCYLRDMLNASGGSEVAMTT